MVPVPGARLRLPAKRRDGFREVFGDDGVRVGLGPEIGERAGYDDGCGGFVGGEDRARVAVEHGVGEAAFFVAADVEVEDGDDARGGGGCCCWGGRGRF